MSVRAHFSCFTVPLEENCRSRHLGAPAIANVRASFSACNKNLVRIGIDLGAQLTELAEALAVVVFEREISVTCRSRRAYPLVDRREADISSLLLRSVVRGTCRHAAAPHLDRSGKPDPSPLLRAKQNQIPLF